MGRWTKPMVEQAAHRWVMAHGTLSAADWATAGPDHPSRKTVERLYGPDAWQQLREAIGLGDIDDELFEALMRPAAPVSPIAELQRRCQAVLAGAHDRSACVALARAAITAAGSLPRP